jgi:hypothetical protein
MILKTSKKKKNLGYMAAQGHTNYLCTYDLYGLVRKVFDLGR